MPSANAGSNQTVTACNINGDTIGGNPTGSGGTAPLTYSWTPGAGLSSDTAANPVVKGIGSTTTYTVVVTDANTCTASSQMVVNVTSSTLQVVILPNTSLFWCQGSGGEVTLTALPANGTGPYTLQWTGVDLSTDTGYYTTVNPDTAGLYVYSVIVTDATGCSVGNSIQVQVFPQVHANPGTTVEAICNGQSVTLGGNTTASGGTPPYTYAWTGGAAADSTPIVSPTSTTTYTVTVTDSNSCSASASITVIVHPDPTANAGPDQSVPTCSPTGVQIGGSPTASGVVGTYTYAWSPAVDLTATNTSNPFVIGLLTDTTYTVTVTDKNGCIASDQVRITAVNTSPLEVSHLPPGQPNIAQTVAQALI